MGDMWRDIEAFHQKFKLPQEIVPNFSTDEIMSFRIKFLAEELQEFIDAYKAGSLIKGFDALLDLVYVAMGTAYIMNVPWDEGWEQVQMANMMKMRAKKANESTRGSTYDVVKPKGWVAPDRMLHSVLIQREHFLLVEKFKHTREESDQEVSNG